MDLQTERPDSGLPDTDTPLQAAVWLVQDLGISMPPIPEALAPRLEEASLGRLFATDPALLELATPGDIAAALDTGWPASGVAFGYIARGTGGRWFYTLASERLILHVSLRLQHADENASRASASLVSQAHGKLERFLAEQRNYFQATNPDPVPDDVGRRIVTFSDEEGMPAELHAIWSPAGGFTEFVARDEIFADRPPGEPIGFERVIWG